jgi:1-acyl-sn-glycerol-3-phosphate acyltransferase
VLQVTVRAVLGPLARTLYRPVVEGRQNVPRQGPVILAANHLSFADSIVIPLAAPRPVGFLAKSEYFDGHGLQGVLTREFFTAVGAIPVRRGTHGAVHEPLETALDVLAEGRAFGIYPEGTRSRDGRLHRGRTGVAWLALRSGAPVVPVGLIGTERIQPVGARLPRIHRVTIRFGVPLHFGTPDSPGPDFPVARGGDGLDGGLRPGPLRRAITDRIVAAIGELTGQERARGYAS